MFQEEKDQRNFLICESGINCNLKKKVRRRRYYVEDQFKVSKHC